MILAIDLAWIGPTGWVLWSPDQPDPIIAYGEFQVKEPSSKVTGANRALAIGRQIAEYGRQLVNEHQPDHVVYEITDWHQDLVRRPDWKARYKQERMVQSALAKAEMALLLGVSACRQLPVIVALGAAEAKGEYGSLEVGKRGRVNKAGTAMLLAEAYHRRLHFVDGQEWKLIDRLNAQPVSHHISDAMMLADVLAARLRQAEIVKKNRS